MLFKQPPEIVALQRWEEGRFLEVERDYARAWRRALSGVDLAALYRKGKAIIERQGRPRDLAESKAMAVAMMNRDGHRYVGLKEALDTFRIPEELRRVVVSRWKAEGGPPLQEFAPYTEARKSNADENAIRDKAAAVVRRESALLTGRPR